MSPNGFHTSQQTRVQWRRRQYHLVCRCEHAEQPGAWVAADSSTCAGRFLADALMRSCVRLQRYCTWNSIWKMTKVSNILHWRITIACRFDADFMRMLNVMTKKLRGTNALLVPPDPKVGGGTCLPWSPWLLRLWMYNSFNFLWRAPKDASFKQQSAYRPITVIQGRWF